MSDWTTNVRQVTVRAAGHVPHRVDVVDAETELTRVTLMLSTAHVRIGYQLTAQMIRDTWRQAAVHRHRLPETAEPGSLATPHVEVGPVAISVTLGEVVDTIADLIPAATERSWPHLRMTVGPLVWEVLDRQAYTSTREAWEKVARQFRLT